MNDIHHRSPFKFLDAYTLEDSDLFFGRENEVTKLYSIFYTYRLTVIYGESGVGKTSLIQCGLRAKIPQEDALFISVRSVIDPLESLKKELLNQLDEKPSNNDDLSDLLEELWYQESCPIVLVFDQFEEFFLLHTRDKRERFTKLLATWIRCNYIRIIISIREDYFAHLDELEKYLPDVFSNRFRMLPMSKKQACDVIIKPCERYQIAVEEGLTAKLLDELLAGSKNIDLPTLQIALDRLYNKAKQNNHNNLKLTLADYHSLGKINQILANFIETCLQQYDNADTMRQVLKAMVSTHGTRQVSRLEQIQEYVGSFGIEISSKQLQQSLRQLNDARIIRENTNNGFYELRHDSLAKTIQDWMTGLEKELVVIRQIIDNRYQEYQQRKTLLDAKSFKELEPYLSRLNLTGKKKQFIEKSHQHIRWQERFSFFKVMSILIIFTIISYFWYQAEQAKQELLQAKQETVLVRKELIQEREKQKDVIANQEVSDDSYHELSNDELDTLWQKLINLEKNANELLQKGMDKQAEFLYKVNQKSLQILANRNPESTRFQLALARNYNNIGNIYSSKITLTSPIKCHLNPSYSRCGEEGLKKNSDKAIDLYNNAAKIYQEIISNSNNNNNIKSQYGLLTAYRNISTVYNTIGEDKKYINAYEKYSSIKRGLTKNNTTKNLPSKNRIAAKTEEAEENIIKNNVVEDSIKNNIPLLIDDEPSTEDNFSQISTDFPSNVDPKYKEIEILTGKFTGTYIKFGNNIKEMVKEHYGDMLDVLVIESKSSIDNIKKLASKEENVSLAIVQSDVIGYLRKSGNKKYENYARELRLVLPFYSEEVHLLGNKSIKNIYDLDNKKIVVGLLDSQTNLTAKNLMTLAKVTPKAIINADPDDAINMVINGQADAMFMVSGKPIGIFTELSKMFFENEYKDKTDEIHFVPLNETVLLSEYVSGELTPDDYSMLKEKVATVATKAVLVAFDSSKGETKYYKNRCFQLEKLSRAVRQSINELKKNKYHRWHKKWNKVNLDKDMVGWKKDECSHHSLKNNNANFFTKIFDHIGNGKWTVVVVWASYCTVCKKNIPTLVNAQKSFPNTQLVGVSLDGKGEKTENAIKDFTINFPTLLSNPQEFNHYLLTVAEEKLEGTPTYLIFAPNGKLEGVQMGVVPPTSIKKFIEERQPF